MLYWISKLLADNTRKFKVDWLPVIVTAPNVEYLLGVQQLNF